MREPPLVPSWGRALALVALAIALSCWAWTPMFTLYPGTSIEDGHMFHFYVASSKATIRYYHELPLWNPFDCKGIPLWDYPENITASPIFWLTVPLTTTQTMMVWNIVHVAAGFIGMWLLARSELKLGRMGALVAASFWAFGVGHTSQYAGEHEALISFLDAPILLLLWRRAERSWNAAVGCGLAIGWMVYDGATYGLPFTVLVLALETFTRVWPVRRIPRLLLAALVVGVVGGAVGASRLLPILAQFGYHKRPIVPDTDHLVNWQSIKDMYMLRSPSWRAHFPNQQYVFGEYISYIGWLGVILAVIGFGLSFEGSLWLVIWGAMIAVLMLGHFHDKAPWSLLNNYVFPFKAMRVPARFRLLLMMPISLWIAIATERVPALVARVSTRWSKAVGIALLGAALLGAGDVVGLGQEIMQFRFAAAAEQPGTRSPVFFYGGKGLAGDFIDQPKQNRAWVGCRSYEWSFHTGAAVWEGDLPQARVSGENAVIERVSRTHNTFTIDVDAKAPARLMLNSAYDAGWRSSVGTVIEASDQLAIDIPEGKHHIVARYWPAHLTLGLWISGLSLLGSILFLARKRFRR